MIYNAVSSPTGCKYHAGVFRRCRSAGAHSRPLFAVAIAREGSCELRAPLRLERLSLFEKYSRIERDRL